MKIHPPSAAGTAAVFCASADEHTVFPSAVQKTVSVPSESERIGFFMAAAGIRQRKISYLASPK